MVPYFYHITVHETLAKMLPLNIGSNNPLCKHEYSRDTFSNKKTLPIYSKEYFMRYILIQKFLWDIFWIKTHIWSSHLGPKQIFLSSSRETSDGKMLRELVDHKCDQQYCFQSLAIVKHCLVWFILCLWQNKIVQKLADFGLYLSHQLTIWFRYFMFRNLVPRPISGF